MVTRAGALPGAASSLMDLPLDMVEAADLGPESPAAETLRSRMRTSAVALMARIARLFLTMGLSAAWPVAGIALCAVCYVMAPLPLLAVRHAAFDQFQRWSPRPYVDAPVRIIDIDDESLRRLGQWPWPRTRMAELTERLQDGGAASIAYDVVFAEPDRTSPKAMIELWRPGDDASRRLAALPDHDDVFARALARGRVVLGFAAGRDAAPSAASVVQGELTSKARFVTVGDDPTDWLYATGRSVGSLPVFAHAAAGIGALSFVPDADGVVRRVPLLFRQGDKLLPSLSAEALRVAQGAGNFVLRSPSGQAGLGDVRVGQFDVPTTPQGEAWVHYTRPVSRRYIPAWKVLAGQVPRQEMEGRILLVGTSAQGLMDLRFSPIAGITPGVEMHAQFLEQVLTGGAIERPSWTAAAELVAIVLGGLLVAGVALGTGARLSSLVVAGIIATWLGIAWYAFTAQGVLVDPLSPALAMLLSFGLASIVRYRDSERRQRWVKDAFSRYVSPNLVDYLVAHPQQLELGGHRQSCSFIFTDLAGFTSLMEQMDPAEAVTLLNEYLDGMIAIAFEHQGTLDRIVGDAVAIVFSAPVQQADHQQRALACALRMQAFAERYVTEVEARGQRFGRTRIGVHTGDVLVGNFGGSHMFDYRALGDPVNTAARLEGANKHLGTWMCVSADTLAGCPQARTRPVGRLVLKGKSRALMVHEPLPEGQDRDEAYEQAFAALCAGAPDAGALFEALHRARPGDALAALHARRMRAGARDELIVLDEK